MFRGKTIPVVTLGLRKTDLPGPQPFFVVYTFQLVSFKTLSVTGRIITQQPTDKGAHKTNIFNTQQRATSQEERRAWASETCSNVGL